MTHKYEVGDKIVIPFMDSKALEAYANKTFLNSTYLTPWMGKIVTIRKLDLKGGFYYIEEDKNNYYWYLDGFKAATTKYKKESEVKMLIRSKFSGKCKKCAGAVEKGDIVEYTPPEKGVLCKGCYSSDDPRVEETPQLVPSADVAKLQAQVDELDKRVGKRESGLKKLEKRIESITEQRPTRVEIVEASKEIKDVGTQHKEFPKLLKMLGQRINILLVGPAGSGKTYAASEASKALTLPFYAVSVGPQTTQAQIFGYMNAQGSYVSTPIRQGYEQGGVVLIDEFDAGNPATLTALNALLSGETCAFPDKMVTKHKDFLVVASANTFGNGADRVYVGRNQLDAASLDRFIPLNWDYDTGFERMFTDSDEWFNLVLQFRKRVAELGMRHVVSIRAIVAGDKLLKAGFSMDECKALCLEKGLSNADRQKISN